MLYRVVCEHLQNLYGYTLKVDAICQDHSAACATAARDTWTETCSIILCWPHISRNAIATNRDKFDNTSLAEDANLHITYVHHSRSQKQFEKLLGLMLAHWTDDLKEEKLALWFKSEYGTGKWTNWHVTSSRIPGFTANNNLEESFSRDAKRGVSIKTDTIGVFITETMPRKIANWSEDLGSKAGPIIYSIPYSPNRHIIQKALQIVTHGIDYQLNEIEVCNYYRVTDTLKLTASVSNQVPSVVNGFNGYVIINDSESLYQSDMVYAMTLERAKKYR